jgi:protein involved in sex pheromone biosynthesis
MKRVITLGLIATVLVFSACKGGKKEEGAENAASTESSSSGTPAEEKNQTANQPKEEKRSPGSYNRRYCNGFN